MPSNITTYIAAVVAIFLTVFLFTVQHLSLQPPAVKPDTAPANEFSAVRAHDILKKLLREGKPHPVGSRLNKLVKQRIIDELASYGIEASEQHTWACANRYNVCAYVENIIAVIPGKPDTPYVTLMSHYDSVPMAPGAGDDGAGVVAMLETARILNTEAPFNHPILLLFTDAEEMGLIGAEGFYNQHPLAEKIDVVLDFEGCGTTGVSMVLRTTQQNEKMMNFYGETSSSPVGFSFANEIFERMPNDTDFSVVQRAGIYGIDFAFAGERNHYHTPNDNVANIDLRAIQHHGENMLPLARKLATEGIRQPGLHHVFANFYGLWISWDERLNGFMVLFSFSLLCYGFIKLQMNFWGAAFAALSSLGIILLTALSCFLGFQLIKLIQGTVVSWPAHDTPYRVALFASAATGGLLGSLITSRYLRRDDMLFGVWFFWLALTTALVVYLPDAANMLVVPTLSASLIIAISTLMDGQARKLFQVLTLVFVIPGTLGLVFHLEESLGDTLIASTFLFFGLFNTALNPLLDGAKLIPPLLASVAITIVSISFVVFNPLYSEWRPQHLNISYFEDLDTGDAFYQLQSPNPLPENIMSLMPFKTKKAALLPFSDTEFENWTQAAGSGYPGPQVDIQNIVRDGGHQTVKVLLRSPRNADAMTLILPGDSELTSFSIDGAAFEAVRVKTGVFADKYFIRIVNIYDREVEMDLAFNSAKPVSLYLSDKSTQLPDTASQLLQKRSPLASPVHQGDQALLFRKIDLQQVD